MLGIFVGYLGSSSFQLKQNPSVLINALQSENEHNGFYKLLKKIRGNQGVEYYNKWVQNVEEKVPQEKLLKFHFKEGWEPLCKFLNVNLPEVPFPNINSKPEFNERVSARRRRSCLVLYEIVSIPVLLYATYKLSKI